MALFSSGDEFTISGTFTSYDQLPVGVYLLEFDSKKGFFLRKKKDFVLPPKLYGDHSITERWKASYQHNTSKNLGIILSGLKGTGKTITAQKFCIEMNKPVILITEDFGDLNPNMVSFLTNKELRGSIIFIDEFEKIYSNRNESSKYIMSLMDGNFYTDFIFLLTVNNFEINEFLVNRLNRIKYRKEYVSLSEDIIKEVINDLLIYPEHKKSIFEFFDILGMCTFDLLISLIKEINLFNENALICGKHLNLRIEEGFFQISEIVNGKIFDLDYARLSAITSESLDDLRITRGNTYLLMLEELDMKKYMSNKISSISNKAEDPAEFPNDEIENLFHFYSQSYFYLYSNDIKTIHKVKNGVFNVELVNGATFIFKRTNTKSNLVF